MNERAVKLHAAFVAEYGEDLDDASELFEQLVSECPDAEDQEIMDFVMESVAENHDEIGNIDDWSDDFSTVWGRKVY